MKTFRRLALAAALALTVSTTAIASPIAAGVLTLKGRNTSSPATEVWSDAKHDLGAAVGNALFALAAAQGTNDDALRATLRTTAVDTMATAVGETLFALDYALRLDAAR